jgi:predicted ester cyclase
MSADTRAIALRWFEEVWNKRREATIDELLTPESVCHADSGPIRGPNEFKIQLFEPFLAAFPDLKLSIDGIVCEGPMAVVRWSVMATHCGNGLGCTATGDCVQMTGITWMRIENGKLMEGWQNTNINDIVSRLHVRAAEMDQARS